MILKDSELNTLCNIAKQAATIAGEYISSHQGSNINLSSKEGGENIASCVVTEIDLQAQKLIINTLSKSISKYNLGLLAEESNDDGSRFNHEYFWCIDPLDGTLCFSKDEDGYSTSIALVNKAGEAIIGVVYNPRTNDLYHAIKGHGAYKNNIKWNPLSTRKVLTLLMDQSYLKHPDYQEHITKLQIDLKRHGLESLNIHHLGGAVMNGISTMEFAPALYYKFPKKPLGGGSIWDFAASSIIQSEAGGYNSDFSNIPLVLNDRESTFMNRAGVIFSSSKSILDLIPTNPSR